MTDGPINIKGNANAKYLIPLKSISLLVDIILNLKDGKIKKAQRDSIFFRCFDSLNYFDL